MPTDRIAASAGIIWIGEQRRVPEQTVITARTTRPTAHAASAANDCPRACRRPTATAVAAAAISSVPKPAATFVPPSRNDRRWYGSGKTISSSSHTQPNRSHRPQPEQHDAGAEHEQPDRHQVEPQQVEVQRVAAEQHAVHQQGQHQAHDADDDVGLPVVDRQFGRGRRRRRRSPPAQPPAGPSTHSRPCSPARVLATRLAQRRWNAITVSARDEQPPQTPTGTPACSELSHGVRSDRWRRRRRSAGAVTSAAPVSRRRVAAQPSRRHHRPAASTPPANHHGRIVGAAPVSAPRRRTGVDDDHRVATRNRDQRQAVEVATSRCRSASSQPQQLVELLGGAVGRGDQQRRSSCVQRFAANRIAAPGPASSVVGSPSSSTTSIVIGTLSRRDAPATGAPDGPSRRADQHRRIGLSRSPAAEAPPRCRSAMRSGAADPR